MTERKGTTETLQPWVPISKFAQTRFVVFGFHDDWEGVRILLQPAEGDDVLRISFDTPVAYRRTDESERLRLWHANSQYLEDLGSLVIIKGSEFIKWLREESADVLAVDDLLHIGIYTIEDCFDVVVREEPAVEVLSAL